MQNLSQQNKETGWYHPNDGKRDQFVRKLTRVQQLMATDQFMFNRANSIATIPFLDRSASKNLPATDVTLNSVVYTRIGEHIELDTYDSISGRMSNNMETQARGIKLGMIRQLSLKLIEGTASPDPIGLRSLSNSTTIGANNNNANGGFMSLQDIYKAAYLTACTDDVVGGGGPDCAVLNTKTLRELLGLINAANGGQGINWMYDADLDGMVLEYMGLQWYISDFVPNNETKGTGTNLTSIYFLKLRGPTGLRLLYARDPNIQEVDEIGIHQYEIPINQTQNRRGMAIEAFWALLAPETACVSRLNGINNTQYAL
ncbi:MAG: hypothetical protein AABZ60_21165 [Planctomycetota bacterium]